MVVNSVPELIQAVESLGGRFMVDGGRLGIVPATAAAPLIDELRRYKGEIVELLAQRLAMPLVSGSSVGNRKPRQSDCQSVQPSRTLIFSSAPRCSNWKRRWMDEAGKRATGDCLDC